MAYIQVTDEELHNLPEDPGAAFVEFEKLLRARLEEAISRSEENNNGNFDYLTLDYMNGVVTAARLYGIATLNNWELASPNNHGWHQYRAFVADVDACTLEMRMRRVRREREYSVVLNAATKIKLSHMLAQMREAVEQLDISVAKKDRLRSRINALQEEIDRERTAFQAFGALMIEVCDDFGEAAKRLAPVVEMVERIGAAIGIAKRSEAPSAQLPPPQKRLEPPKNSKKRSSFDKALEDEVPF